jgi:hypothetical protein
MEEPKSAPKQTVIFPDGIGAVIIGLIKKYGLEGSQNAAIKNLTEAKEYQEKIKAAEDLPGRKIARIVKETAEGRIKKQDLSFEIQRRLVLAKETAENLAKEIEATILPTGQMIAVIEEKTEEENTPTNMPATVAVKKPAIPNEKKSVSKTEPAKKYSKPDAYRETVE